MKHIRPMLAQECYERHSTATKAKGGLLLDTRAGWQKGGGFRGGHIHGATDDFGYHAVEAPVSIYDLWATVQQQMVIRHEDLTYLFGGRYFRLSDVEGARVVKVILS